MTVHGLLLAAGAGSRMGTPKALVVGDDGEPWLRRSVAALLDGGCNRVTVVLGAAADRAVELLPPGPVDVVVAEDWADGMSTSLRVGLESLAGTGSEAALVSLVDLPDVGADVVRRVLAAGSGAGTLARATYAGTPGHPVLIGRDHWAGLLETLHGDTGARGYLGSHPVTGIECGDLATGRDVDAKSE